MVAWLQKEIDGRTYHHERSHPAKGKHVPEATYARDGAPFLLLLSIVPILLLASSLSFSNFLFS
jgi:hypothetical protein